MLRFLKSVAFGFGLPFGALSYVWGCILLIDWAAKYGIPPGVATILLFALAFSLLFTGFAYSTMFLPKPKRHQERLQELRRHQP